MDIHTEVEDPLQGSASYGSSGLMLDELISLISHNHPLFKSYNGTVHSLLEETTHDTVHESKIKPEERRNDGIAQQGKRRR